MKFAVLILAGATDEPFADLDERTPLAAASAPAMDELAAGGRLGLASMLPPDSEPLGEALLLSVLGYDPREHAPARGPIESLALGVRLGRQDRALRLNLVTVRDGRLFDAAGGLIRDREAAELLAALRPNLPPDFELHAGQSFRHLLVWRGCGALSDLVTKPPHACVDQPVDRHLPRGRGAERLLELMQRAAPLLESHDVNAVRRELGEQPANALWPHGAGLLPTPPSFESRFGVRGQMVAGSLLARGVGRLVRLRVATVPGASGLPESDFSAKGLAAVAALDASDLVCVHVEGADEAGHAGDAVGKVRVLEGVDAHIVAPLLARLRREPSWRMLVIASHATPVARRVHATDPVVFAIGGSDIASNRGDHFDESAGRLGELYVDEGWHLMSYFLKG